MFIKINYPWKDWSDINENSIADISAFILSRLTTGIPSGPLKYPELIKFPNIKLSDPINAQPVIDIIRINIYEQVIGNEWIEVCDGIYTR